MAEREPDLTKEVFVPHTLDASLLLGSVTAVQHSGGKTEPSKLSKIGKTFARQGVLNEPVFEIPGSIVSLPSHNALTFTEYEYWVFSVI